MLRGIINAIGFEISIVLLALIVASLRAGAAPLPSAPDSALYGGIITVNALDWASTEECLRRPYVQCHESILPSALVQSKAGFAAYKATPGDLWAV